MSKVLELIDIQKLQFKDKVAAETALLAFLQANEDSAISKIELHPKPESLNSINGFITYDDGERYFFKTHTEENEQVCEYYNAGILASAGYPMVRARQITHRPGKQIALYEILSFPTLFDLIKQEEDSLLAGSPESPRSQQLVDWQIDLDRKVFEVYCASYAEVTAEEDRQAPIHQLFSNRLAEDGRLGLFYRNKEISLNSGQLAFEQLANMRWIINGVDYSETLSQIIERSSGLLEPNGGVVVVGHGDAHNGNVFVDVENQQFLLFDPAFAGRHSPLLDLVKPLFHNVFARWMYYPEQVAGEFELRHEVQGNQIVIEHNFFPSAIRQEFFQSRKDNVLKPTVKLLKERGQLPENWQVYLRSALFCCPFLTVNLYAPSIVGGTLAERYPESIKLLGLAMAVELGTSASRGTNRLKEMIDGIFD